MSSHLLPSQKTPFAKNQEIKKKWVLIDATNQTLGRLASFIVHRLQGKYRVDFSPHQDVGDYVVVINADKVKVTGKKETDKIYYRYSGYPGGLKKATFREKIQKNPTEVLELAVKRMLPDGRRGRKLLKHLKIYSGPNHPHIAQKPELITINYKKM
ncbi:MAG: 50S ribosomal protein L13 [Leptospiraceae bacterium]|nr:50S ribosomal protein L13 [Leptospiraceae bacterium]MDW7976395.1 50S ribosomal protein L13 [Leptospiraceae bacterium]